MPEHGGEVPCALRGCRVLVLRPAHQSGALCRLIESFGGVAHALPTLDIVPVADPAGAAVRLERAKKAQRWIFSSSNAVRHAVALVSLPWPAAAAVGAATAAALAELGIDDVLVPSAGDGAAALLARPELEQVRGRSIALIAGEQPLPELEVRLRERGAQVETIAVYRRVPLPHSPDAVVAALADADVVIAPSAEALQHLVSQTPPDARDALLGVQLALPSSRVVEKARELGFRLAPLLPQRVSDAAYVDALLRYRNPGEAGSSPL